MVAAYFGPKWGGSAFGTAGGTVTWSFAAGVGSIFDYDAAITSPTYQAAVRLAFAAWESVANIDFVEVQDGSASNIRLGWDSFDGVNGTLGQAYMQYLGNSATHSEVAFDSAERWTPAYAPGNTGTDFYAVAVHEIGHAIGLDHSDSTASIMYPYLGDQHVLGSEDIAAIRALYGASVSPSVPLGTDGNDILAGTSGADTLSGGAGADSIDGFDGADALFGGTGSDTIGGGLGNDILFGGQGDDADQLFGGDGDDQAYGGGGNDSIGGGAGNDMLGGGTGADTIEGGSGNDAMFGGAGADADRIDGGAGADRIFAGDGNDTVIGGDGDDEIGGGRGADLMIGGTGNDIVYLGAHDGAADLYQSVANNGSDTIYGFENGIDHLDLRASGFTSFALVQAALGTAADGDATITLASGQVLTLDAVAVSALDASDFVF